MHVAIALACDRLVPSFPATQVEPFFTFLTQNGVLGICRRTYSGRRCKPASLSSTITGRSSALDSSFTFETHFSGPSSANETEDQIRRSSSCLVARRDISPRLIRVSRAQMAVSD